jgi:pimeloyl-ACP methyl ester carboxylesterase
MAESFVETNGVRLRAVSEGEGPLVLMLHGFPGLAWSWRRQMRPLAEAGFKAVAIDSLGYGGSDRPLEARLYASDRINDYLNGVLDHFGADSAFVVGQDFGAQYAWNLTVRSPQRVRALAATIPYDYDMAGRGMLGSASTEPEGAPVRPEVASPNSLPTARFAAMAAHAFVHLHYFQEIGPGDRELANQPAEFLKRILWALSSKGDLFAVKGPAQPGQGYLDRLPPAPDLPWDWLSKEEFDACVAQFDHPDPMRRFIGGMNSYRTADINWEIGRAFADADVATPTLFIYGADDPTMNFFPDWEARMRKRVPGLTRIAPIAGAGHFAQQEQADAFNAALISFLKEQA